MRCVFLILANYTQIVANIKKTHLIYMIYPSQDCNEISSKRCVIALETEYHSAKPVGKALEEIADGKVSPVIPQEFLG
jgi:hypothetical protein